MKKFISFAICISAILAVAPSCNKFLETKSPSTTSADMVFSNYDLAEKAVFGISEVFCEVNSYRGRFLPWYGFNTDIEWYNTYKATDDKYKMAGYCVNSNNGQMNTASNGATNNPWALMYSGIERANLVIEGLRTNADLTDESMKYLLGEALTLRAMIYYDLIKAWGDVPARFAPVNSETIYLPKSDRDEIYIQILADLKEAFEYLPYPGKTPQTSRTDRINKAFAQGLYARIALAAAGYALRPEEGRVGTGDPGSIRLSSKPELSKATLYPEALGYLKEVIASGSCSLEPSFENYWYKQNNMNNMVAGPSSETLYVIPFGEGRGRWNFTFAVNSEGAPISGGVSRGGDAGPTPVMFYNYGPGDTRRDVTCINYKWNKDGSIEPSGIGKWYFGKYRFEWMDAQPYTGGNDDGIKPVVMRYADILLMAAEIENELNGPAGAADYLKAVRARACGEDAAESFVQSLSSKEDFFNAIVDERALEFCGEFLRKGDLIRWNLLKAKMDESKARMFKLRDLQDEFSDLSSTIWYRLADDEISLEIKGLCHGETTAPEGDWEVKEKYIGPGCYDDTKKPDEGIGVNRVNGIYYIGDGFDNPERFMYWPIFDCNRTDSQGALVNDYGYAS